MSCSVNVQQIIGPLNTLVIERQEDAGDPGSITTTNIIITNDFLQQIEVVDVCRGGDHLDRRDQKVQQDQVVYRGQLLTYFL